MHDERVEVIAQALRGGGVARPVQLLAQGLESLLAVALAGGLVQCLLVGRSDAFALPLGQLRQQVAHAMDGAVLAV